MFFISCNYLIVFLFVLGQQVYAQSAKTYATKNDWIVVFYTSRKLFAGTDNTIYIQLHGSSSSSDVIYMRPQIGQLEQGGVDRFPFQLVNNIGQLSEITIGKERSSKLFSDWYLDRAVLIDPMDNKYAFLCDPVCQFTPGTQTYRLSVSSSTLKPNDRNRLSSTTTRTFPVVIGLLILCVLIFLLIYMINLLYQKWKLHGTLFLHLNRNNSNRRRIERINNQETRRTTNRNNGGPFRPFLRRLGLSSDKDDDDDDDVVGNAEVGTANEANRVNNQANRARINPQSTSSSSASESRNLNFVYNTTLDCFEDKPPDYKELFPSRKVEQHAKVTSNNVEITQAGDDDTRPTTNHATSIELEIIQSNDAINTEISNTPAILTTSTINTSSTSSTVTKNNDENQNV